MSFENETTLNRFNFNLDHEAIVLDTSDFEDQGKIKVFQPDFFVGQVYDSLEDRMISLDESKLLNKSSLTFSSTVGTVNYIECYPLVFNFLDKKYHEPELLDTVILRFVNGDPKLPYYINGHYFFNKPEVIDPGTNPNKPYKKWGYERIIKLTTPNMFGPDVDKVCSKLVNLGFPILKINNRYEYTTKVRDLIVQFQNLAYIEPDGEVGPITYSSLMIQKDGW
jgi:hypothetical protein